MKSEPGAVSMSDNHHALTPSVDYGGSSGGSGGGGGGVGGQLSDPAAMDYGDEYGDYEGAYDNDGSYDGSGLDQSMGGSADGNKGRKEYFFLFFCLPSSQSHKIIPMLRQYVR